MRRITTASPPARLELDRLREIGEDFTHWLLAIENDNRRRLKQIEDLARRVARLEREVFGEGGAPVNGAGPNTPSDPRLRALIAEHLEAQTGRR